MSTPRETIAWLTVVAAAGGSLGAVLRWTVGELLPTGTGFPWSTFAVNVSGTALLALLPAWPPVARRRDLAVFLGTGIIGGFTTLSAYAEETRALMAAGNTWVAASYVLGTLAACLTAVAVARHWVSPSSRRRFHEEEGDR